MQYPGSSYIQAAAVLVLLTGWVFGPALGIHRARKRFPNHGEYFWDAAHRLLGFAVGTMVAMPLGVAVILVGMWYAHAAR